MSFKATAALFVTITLLPIAAIADFSEPPVKITSPTPADFAQFGYSVSRSGEYIAVGSHGDDTVQNGSGAVFIYKRDLGVPSGWVLVKTLAVDGVSRFGGAVVLRGDTLAVQSSDGGTYVYEKNFGGPDEWGLSKNLPGSSALLGFGRSIDLDGDILVVGDGLEDRVHVYDRHFGGLNNWGLRREIFPAGEDPFRFGHAVGISGEDLVVGHPGFIGTDGHAHVFKENLGGSHNWGEVTVLEPTPPTGSMGFVVAIDEDIIAMADFSSHPVLIYERDLGGQDNWGLRTELVDPLQPSDGFISASVESDRVVASTQGSEQVINIFDRNAGGSDAWGNTGRLSEVDSLALGSSIDFSSQLLVAGDFSNPQVGDEAGAVYIYSTQGRLEIVDVYPDLIKAGRVNSNIEDLANDGRVVSGAVTDGTTRLLLRYTAPSDGTVSFVVSGTPSENGGVDEVGGEERLAEVSVATVATSRGLQAFAVYRVPEEFDLAGTSTIARQRPITLAATFQPSAGGSSESHIQELLLYRPPLVFVHGLWSEPSSWELPLIDDSRFLVKYRVDYEDSHADSLHENRTIVRTGIKNALDAIRAPGIAATQADVIGHSMGGVLSRIWTTDSQYLDNLSYLEGSVRKLVTLDSPHDGSPLALVLSELGLGWQAAFALVNRPIHKGAIDDLVPGSDALSSIGASQVPSHTLIGTGGSDLILAAPLELLKVFGLLDWAVGGITGTEIFGGEAHDLIVAEGSQAGGLGLSARTTINGDDGIHTNNTKSSVYSLEIENLLDTPVTTASFDMFPAASIDTPNALLKKLGGLPDLNDGSETIVISDPPPGTSFSPGDTISVSVAPVGGIEIESVWLSGDGVDGYATDDDSPFAPEIVVSSQAIGEIVVFAVARDNLGRLFQSDPLPLSITQVATIESINVLPETLVLRGTGDTGQIRVLATFTDGVVREVTPASLGTTYDVVFPQIATLDDDGLATADQFGETPVTIVNGSASASARILSVPIVQEVLFEDGFESGTTSAWSVTVN